MSVRLAIPVRILVLCGLLALAGLARAGAADDTGRWSVTVRQAGEWTPAPELPAEADVFCHLHGAGRFRVTFRQGEALRRYTADLPVRDWAAFTRHLTAGPTAVRVEPLPDERVPDPKFTGLIVTANPDFRPALADFEHPLYARVANLAGSTPSIRVIAASTNPQRFYYDAGALTVDGLAPGGTLAARGTSRPLNLSRLLYGRSVLSFHPPATGETQVEIRLSTDAAGTRAVTTLRLEGAPAPAVYLIVYPQPDGSLRCVTGDELMRTRLMELQQALRADRRPVPARSYVSTGVSDPGEAPATYRLELALARLAGANAAAPLGRLESERAALGFTAYWWMDFPAITGDWLFDAGKAADYVTSHRSQLPHGQRGVLIMSDEPGFAEIEKGPALDKRFIAWLQAKRLTPADAGAASWNDVHCIAPTPSQPRLSVLSRDFQREEEIRAWSGWGQAFRAVEPGLAPAVNFSVDLYFSGDRLNLWELYRRPGLEIVWAEDWHGYMPLGMGAIAWYADLMRSQAKYRKLPTGTYPILGYGYSPALDAMRYYERFMRGCTHFNLYTYSPRGNEPSWLDRPEVMINLARRHRDLAEVEDVLIDGAVLSDRVALLYPNSCGLWDATAFEDIFGLYAALLHAGYAVDIVTEQDLADGLARDYALLYVAGANFRPDTLPALDAFIRGGGTVACTSPCFLDLYNAPIAGAPALFGARSVEKIADAPTGGYAYGYKAVKALDTVQYGQQALPIYCQQSRLTPADGARAPATFADRAPALLKTARGKGQVYLYAFSPGVSYLKAEYGDNGGFATGLCRNDAMRALCALPAAGLARRITCSAAMVSSRIVAAKAGAVVGLVDYGIGRQGRATPNLSQAAVDFETMAPYPVTVRIACKARPTAVRAIRAGRVAWRYAAGALTVEVPLRGVDMLKVDGRGLF